MELKTAYHFLRDDYRAGQGDEKPWEIGETRIIPAAERKAIALCKYGYHFCPTLFDALMYAPGSLACLVEVPGDAQVSKEDFPKGVSYQRMLVKAVRVERELRLFAADCAERVLHVFERERPNDDRPRKAIQAARDFANGKIGAAARDAAWAAARAAARDAARDAAWAAAWDAARAAAWDAETEWQRQRFAEMFDGIFDKEQSR